MESDEYLYLIKDPDNRVIFAIRRDGSVTWQKGVPQVVKDAISPTINNDEYVYLITDPDNHVLFTIKKDGSIDWQKGVPKPIQEKIFTDKIDNDEFVQLTQDAEGKLIEGITADGTRKFMAPVKFNGGVEWRPQDLKTLNDALGTNQRNQFYYKNYERVKINTSVYSGLNILYLTGNLDGISKDNKVNMGYEYLGQTGTCTLKWQGSSSIAFPKKNYTLGKVSPKLDLGWGLQNKYVLKADFVDISHARNLTGAKLWSEVVKSRIPQNERLLAAPNCGAVDGFPIMLVINDEYQGLYTFNIPKDPWLFDMGSGDREAIVTAEQYSDATLFREVLSPEDFLSGQYWEIAYIPDESNPDWLVTSFNRMVSAVINSTGTNYRNTLSPYLDIESAIDYYILCTILAHADGIGKNIIMATYDGTKWFFSAYDMDWTFGMHSWGTHYLSAKEYGSFYGLSRGSRVFHLIYAYDKAQLKTRYNELRNTVFSDYNIVDKISNLLVSVPSAVVEADSKLWPTTPGTLMNNFAQMTEWFRCRVKILDEEIANM
jgi:hypothetical protein